MDTYKRNARIVGVLFIIGTVSGILSVVSTGSIRGAQDPLLSISENGTPLILGAIFVLTMGLALAMVPVVAFPVLRKHNEILAIGYVVFRGGLEAVTYMAMVVSWLLLLPLSQVYQAGTPGASNFQVLGEILLESSQLNSILTIVFILGAVMFYYVLYRSKLTPRWLSGWGLIAAVPYIATAFLTMFGSIDSDSAAFNVMVLPLAVQEMVLAVWLIVKGFNPSAITSGYAKADIH
jgi:hypothetical protein